MLIRRITLADIPTIVAMGEQFVAESPHYALLTYDPKETTDLLHWFLDHPDRLAILAADCGEPIGFFLGYITTFAFSKAPLAQDTALYVCPARRGQIGRRLIETYLDWAQPRAERIMLSETSGIAPEAFDRLARRCGFKRLGTHYALQRHPAGRPASPSE